MNTVEAHGSSAAAQQGRQPAPRTPVWDVVTVPCGQGLEAVDILRLRTRVGPVLHDGDTLGFLVPAGTSAGWDLPGSACTGTAGRGGRRLPADASAAGAGWLLPPEHAAPVTDPALLRMALGEAARTIEAAGGHRPR